VSEALSLEMLRAPVMLESIKFRGLLINTNLPHAGFYSRRAYKHFLARERSDESLFVIYSALYADKVKEMMMLIITVKTFLNVFMKRLKLWPT
jgi:hypothetical protein